MSIEKKSSGSSAINFVVGAVLMFGGAFAEAKFADAEAIRSLRENPTFLFDPFKTISTIGVFLIVFPLIKTFFTDPLSNAIHERNANLEHTFSEAESLRAEMTKMRNDYETRLGAAEASAREHIEAQIKEAQNLRQTLMNEAATRADAMIERAQQEIVSERERVLGGLRTQVVELSLVAAEKIVGENMDTERNRKLVDEFVSGLEVAR